MGFLGPLLMALPLLLNVYTWKAYKKAGKQCRWKDSLFRTGFVLSTISSSVLVCFLCHEIIISLGTTPFDLDRAYPVLSMIGCALAASILGLFGKRVPGLTLSGNALFTAFMWYLAALGASP